MDEYISRHEAIRAVQLSYGNYEATRNALYEIPAADVAPVRHGWWVYEKTYQGMKYVCSECGEIPECFELNFSPNCGAIMDGAE